jgi:hypothetical protein
MPELGHTDADTETVRGATMGDSNGGFFKGAGAVGVLAAGLGIGYYFGLYLPERDHARSAAVAECVNAVDEQYRQLWDDSCKQSKLGKNCKLNVVIATTLNESRRQSEGFCYRPIP